MSIGAAAARSLDVLIGSKDAEGVEVGLDHPTLLLEHDFAQTTRFYQNAVARQNSCRLPTYAEIAFWQPMTKKAMLDHISIVFQL